VSHVDEASGIAERMRLSLLEPFLLDGHELFVSASIGVAVADRPDVEHLIVEADTAMYRAKDEGRGRVVAGSADVRAEVRAQLRLEADLHRALERDELRLHYQPVVDLVTGTAVGHEALLRWEHPELGLLGPDRFVRLAEDTGLIVALGGWALARACADWASSGRSGNLAVNLSARQLLDPEVVDVLVGILRRTGLAPHRLVLEVTESVLLTDVAATQVAALRALGIRVAVDDFGTGYSSLSLLRELPVDVLKVDRTFVSRMGEDRPTDAVLGAIVSLADALDLELIAEGIETEVQARALRSAGCRYGQGFLFGRPQPLTAAAAPPVGVRPG
jgi:EAL domain-containing protein (putative c-di-GMP-specific phosphodiesterase class I)